MKILLQNITVRELLCFTIVAAALTQWWLHRSRIKWFAGEYSRLQRTIAEYESRAQALADLHLKLTETDDSLEVMRQHNVSHADITCGIYFDPKGNRWHAALVDQLPGRKVNAGGWSGETVKEAISGAEPSFFSQPNTLRRLESRIDNALGIPCRASYDADARALQVLISVEGFLGDRAIIYFDRDASRRADETIRGYAPPTTE